MKTVTSSGISSVSENILLEDDSVRRALETLSKTSFQIALVVDGAGRLLRTITDGDIRRGLLGGLHMDSAVRDLPGQKPIVAHADTTDAELQRIGTMHHVSHVVVVDPDNCPLEIKSMNALRERILLSPPHMGTTEEGYVSDAFRANWIAPAGPNLERFEEQLCAVSARKHAIAVSSGTAGLHLALVALNLPKSKTVYVSDKTFVATLQPLLYEGLEPVLIDSEPETWNMSPEALERRLKKDAKDGRLPGAIVLVHLYGQPAKMAQIVAIAQTYNVPIIEDAAESLGGLYDNQPSGYHGVLSVYSFNGNKIITTSGGGAVVTDDANMAARIRYLATQGRDTAEHYQHSHIAYNYRMSNILAGVGLGQLEVLQERVIRRREIFEIYSDALSDIEGVSFQKEAERSKGNRWLTVMRLDVNKCPIHVYQLMRALQRSGIETRPSWKPMHMQPLCDGMSFEPHSSTEVVSSSVFLSALCLPSGSSMTHEQQAHVISEMRNILTQENN